MDNLNNSKELADLKEKITKIEQNLVPTNVSISIGEVGICGLDLISCEATLSRVLSNPKVYKYLVSAKKKKNVIEGYYG
jgi:hypothetical protein